MDPGRLVATLREALERLASGYDGLPPFSTRVDYEAVREAALETAARLLDNLPYGHPLYIGQMMKPPHPAAWLASALASSINPNNHALDGGRATSAMEKEAVAQLAGMFGWTSHVGHLTGGGVVANLEALWVARELAPGRAVAASAQAHYTHGRAASILQIPFRTAPVDARGRMDAAALRRELDRGGVGVVVATAGTTAAGAVDPIDEIVELRERYGFRLHVDAAYGGYYTLVEGLAIRTRRALDALSAADSIAVDPHKHGLQPYGCGCVLFRDPTVGRVYRHDSPYTYFTSSDLHLGEISLECSRPGASAAALWTTHRLLPPIRGGEFARGLARARGAALALHRGLLEIPECSPLFEPELDVVAWAMRAPTASAASRAARRVFARAAAHDVHFALARFPRGMVEPSGAVAHWDADDVVCLRACVMKPEHADWTPEILARLRRAIGECAGAADRA